MMMIACTCGGSSRRNFLEKAVCNNQYATFRRINSAHGHGDKEVWLGIGEDRAFVEQFLSQVSDIGLS